MEHHTTHAAERGSYNQGRWLLARAPSSLRIRTGLERRAHYDL
jgi:hypothetical protein